MYAYHKKSDRKKIIALGCALLVLCGVAFTIQWYVNKDHTKIAPVIKEEEEMVVTLPDEAETVIAPFNVEASVVLEYFDGSDHEVNDYTNFNGVYRGNQGIDYAYNNENFDVLCMASGVVSEVKVDEMFGNTVTIESGKLKITYQSLDAINVKKGDKIKQKDVLAKASSNVYNPELNNHLHIVCEKDGVIVDPKLVIHESVEVQS
ncbi:MAG: M23 family metallopeptidase [Erysipelotrichia bacterium]|nr:M23 family metallopeptidase [Erysipelotrichia bacterium]